MKDQESLHKEKLPSVTIVGVYIKSDAYPNVKHKVDGLLKEKSLRVSEINFPPGYIQRLGHSSLIPGFMRTIGYVLYFGYAHIRAIFAIIALPRPRSLYIPYPAIFVLYLLSLLPARLRPDRICADAFISLYDTIVEDRRLVSRQSIIAKLLYSIERRAYRIADLILVDTELNVSYLSSTFNIHADRVIALPLSINEGIYTFLPYVPAPNRCNVLFVGTFVPLQGVEEIAQAIVLLQAHHHIYFRLIGNGQTSRKVSAILEAAGCANVTWDRHWHSAAKLAEAISQSDICLGIFGSGAKSQRVWPLKNYAYMATGRAIITADTQEAREILSNSENVPFITVPAGQPKELADAIVNLANDPERRMCLAKESRLYYEQYLSNEASLNKLLGYLSS
jgi:glycosyltransferase involved in cell wall biosynthesis